VSTVIFGQTSWSRVWVSMLVCLALVMCLEGCLFTATEKKAESIVVSVKPEIPMSEEYVRSRPGDMLAFLPQGWFLVDVEGKASSDVIAVAVNPDYTLTMVVQNIRKNDLIDQVVQKEGLLGLTRLAFEKRQRKTSNSVRLLNKFTPTTIGSRSFGMYEFTGSAQDTTSAILHSRSAVFTSSLGNYYEVSLTPTTISGKSVPPDDECARVFRSIIASLQL
jgi:hypothetical protein